MSVIRTAALRSIAWPCSVAILRRANWNTRRSAEQLGMHRATLYRHMQRFGIRVPLAALLDEPGRLESRVSGAAE